MDTVAVVLRTLLAPALLLLLLAPSRVPVDPRQLAALELEPILLQRVE